MPGKSLTPYVVLALVLTGTVCVGLRFQARRDVRSGLADSAWRLTYVVEGEAEEEGAQFRVALPSDTPHCRVFRQDLRHSNLRLDPLRVLRVETLEIVAVAEDEDDCELTLRFDLHLTPQAEQPHIEAPVSLSADERAKYVEGDDKIQVNSRVVAEVLEGLRGARSSNAGSIEGLFEYCRREITLAEEDAPDDAEGALRGNSATPVGRAQAMTALCRASGIPARLVAGFEIEPGKEIDPHVWVEALTGDRWVPYDPTNGFAGKLPYNYLAIRRGGAEIVTTTDVDETESEFTIVQLPGVLQGMNTGVRHPLDVLDLTRLPLEMHRVLSLILLMPLGAMVTCVFRNLIGIQTSGTFTPTLLALSFVFTDWRTGLVVLVAVVVLGFATRNLLDRLKLLMLPRLSILLTLVVCCIVFGISLLDYFRLTPGVQAVLLPMVILTMIVERFYVTTQEDGLSVAVQRLAGTVVVGFFCYIVLRWETVARILLVYPEAHFFTVALLILIGRYTGYQLLEPWRFRDAVEVEP